MELIVYITAITHSCKYSLQRRHFLEVSLYARIILRLYKA